MRQHLRIKPWSTVIFWNLLLKTSTNSRSALAVRNKDIRQSAFPCGGKIIQWEPAWFFNVDRSPPGRLFYPPSDFVAGYLETAFILESEDESFWIGTLRHTRFHFDLPCLYELQSAKRSHAVAAQLGNRMSIPSWQDRLVII